MDARQTTSTDPTPDPPARPLRADDRAHQDYEQWAARQNQITMRAMLLTVAICIAPFLILPFGGVTPSLVVLAVGLAFTAWLCWSGGNHVGPAARGRLRTMGVLNGVLALFVAGLVALLL